MARPWFDALCYLFHGSSLEEEEFLGQNNTFFLVILNKSIFVFNNCFESFEKCLFFYMLLIHVTMSEEMIHR